MKYIQAKFHDGRFRNSSNIMVIISTIRETVLFVLRMRGFLKYALEMTSAGMTYIHEYRNMW
jgi:hypothetical protein